MQSGPNHLHLSTQIGITVRLLLRISFLVSLYRENLITLAPISYVALLDISVEKTKLSVNYFFPQEGEHWAFSQQKRVPG